MKCPQCRGRKKVPKYGPTTKKVDCPYCKGTGKILDAKKYDINKLSDLTTKEIKMLLKWASKQEEKNYTMGMIAEMIGRSRKAVSKVINNIGAQGGQSEYVEAKIFKIIQPYISLYRSKKMLNYFQINETR